MEEKFNREDWVQKDEWYTPREIIESVGHFDLDPCAPMEPLFQTADVMYNKNDDGLSKSWQGRVWLNPPYSQPLLNDFMSRMADHNNGIALLFNRCDSLMFRKYVLERAIAIRFLYQRIKFYYPSGQRGNSPRCGNIMVAYGEQNAHILRECQLPGKLVFIDPVDTF